MKKKALIIFGVVLAILVITNPSTKSFYYYSGKEDNGYREYNFFVCSIYSTGHNYRDERYLGIVGNFISLNKKESHTETIIKDSATEEVTTEYSFVPPKDGKVVPKEDLPNPDEILDEGFISQDE